MVKLFITLASIVCITQAHAMEEDKMSLLSKQASVKPEDVVSAKLEDKALVKFKNISNKPVTIEASVTAKVYEPTKTNLFSSLGNFLSPSSKTTQVRKDIIKTKKFKIEVAAGESRILENEHFKEKFKSKEVEVIKFSDVIFYPADWSEIAIEAPLNFRTQLTFKNISDNKVTVETASF